MKNLEFAAVLPFAQQVQYQKGQVVSKTIAQSKALSLTLFAFDKGEEIGTHASDGDALVIVLDGQGQIIIDDTSYILNAGDSIIMPAQHPHSVFAKEQFKMFLVVEFPLSSINHLKNKYVLLLCIRERRIINLSKNLMDKV